MLKPTYDYQLAFTLGEASKLLAGPAQTCVIAGGTDLLLDIREGKCRPEVLVDVSRLPEIKKVYCDEEGIFIGAGLSFSELWKEPLIRKHFSALSQAAGMVGSPQIRNRGTIGGNLVTGSAAGDTVCPVTAFDGNLVLIGGAFGAEKPMKAVSLSDRRFGFLETGEAKLNIWSIGLEKFWKPDLKKHVGSRILLLGICFPYPKNRRRSAFIKLGRRESLAISRLNLTLAIEEDEAGVITWSRVAVGSAGPHPYRVPEAEACFLNRTLNDVDLRQLQERLSEKIDEALGSRSTVHYKAKAIQAMALEGYRRLAETVRV